MRIGIKTIPLLFSICLLARAGFGAEPIATFAKQSLDLDLASIPFGSTASTNSEYGATSAPQSTDFLKTANELTWMTNSVSAKYNHDFNNRILRYGFCEGKLVVIRISINSFLPSPNDGAPYGESPIIKQRRQELIKIQEDLLKASSGHHLSFDDGTFQTRYGAMCASTPESLFLIELEIAPAGPRSRKL